MSWEKLIHRKLEKYVRDFEGEIDELYKSNKITLDIMLNTEEKSWYYKDKFGRKTYIKPIGKLRNGFFLLEVLTGDTKGSQINLHLDDIKSEVSLLQEQHKEGN